MTEMFRDGIIIQEGVRGQVIVVRGLGKIVALALALIVHIIDHAFLRLERIDDAVVLAMNT